MRTKSIISLLLISINMCTGIQSSDSGQPGYSYGVIALASTCAGIGIGIGAYFSRLAYKGWKRSSVNKKLYTAALENNPLAAHSALQEGADITMYREGSTPLMWAAWRGSSNVAKIITNKASELAERNNVEPSYYLDQKTIDQPNRHWSIGNQLWYPTALHVAANTGCLDTVKALVDARADYKVVDNVGRNALLHAAIGGHNSVVRYLLTLPGVNVEQEKINLKPLFKEQRGLQETVESVQNNQVD